MKFIELISDATQGVISISIDNIEYYESMFQGKCRIKFVSGNAVIVNQSYEQVKKQIPNNKL